MRELRRQLAHKSDWYGSRLVIADRFYPSSKTCSGCGVIKDTLSLAERAFDCDTCGLSLDRDENASINLRKLALAELPEGLREVTPVERKALAPECGRETGLAEAGSDSSPRRRRNPQIGGATRRGEGWKLGPNRPRESRTPPR